MRHILGLSCILSKSVICCSWYYQYPGRRFPSSFSGAIVLFPQSCREGVIVVVTWSELLEFCILITTIISLVIQVNNKEK